MDKHKAFEAEKASNIEAMSQDSEVSNLGLRFLNETAKYKYSYNYNWLGRPIIQFPQDMVALQEIVWSVRPDLIIETGIAHGGSIVFSASMLELVHSAFGVDGKVLAVDIDIRAHNRAAIEAHPFSGRIDMIEGSSIDPDVIESVKQRAGACKRVLVILDSNHTHDHVFAELTAYAPLVTPGSYCVVMDTVIEDMPEDAFPGRPWGVGNNPKTAVHAWLQRHPEFQIDKAIENKLLLTVAPDGYLMRT